MTNENVFLTLGMPFPKATTFKKQDAARKFTNNKKALKSS